jgi:uncharacterized protein
MKYYFNDLENDSLIARNMHFRSFWLPGHYPINEASFDGDIEEVNRLIALGVNLDTQGDLGDTPLRSAVVQNHTHVLKILLANFADPNILDRYKKIPLQYAEEQGNQEAIELLRNHKEQSTNLDCLDILKRYQDEENFSITPITVNTPNDFGFCPIHIAVERNEYYELMALVNAGADVNAIHETGVQTALHLAISLGHFTMMRYLLKKGADSKIKNGFGHTALDVAMLIGEPQQLFYLYTWDREAESRN